jgi:hypothetical protein
VNTLTSPADNGRDAGRHMNDALLERGPEAVDQLIARVLRQAHTTADTLDEPNEARAILHLAHSFADELATTNPRFDRLRFIKDATEDPS